MTKINTAEAKKRSIRNSIQSNYKVGQIKMLAKRVDEMRGIAVYFAKRALAAEVELTKYEGKI